MAEREIHRDHLRDIVFILFSQKRIFLIVAAVVAAATLAVAFLAPPKYLAQGALLVKGKKLEVNPGSLERADLRPQPVTKEDLYSEVEILTSEEVLVAAVRDLIERKVLELPADSELPRAETERGMAGEIALKLETQVVPSSNVIEASFTNKRSQTAQAILEAVFESYLAYRNQVFNPPKMGAFFSDQVSNYLNELKKKEQNLLALVNVKQAPDVALEISNNLSLRSRLQSQLQDFENERIDLGSRIEVIERHLKSPRTQSFAFIESQAIQELGSRLQGLLVEQARVEKSFLPSSPQAAEIRDQVQGVSRSLRIEVTAYLESLKGRQSSLSEQIDSLNARLAEIDKRNLDLKELEVVSQRIKQESDLLAFSFETFYKRREQANMEQRDGNLGLTSDVMVLRQAKAGLQPAFPDKNKLIPIGFVVALVAGVTVAFLAHIIDTSIKRPEDVMAALGLPVLFSIPDRGDDWSADVARRPALAGPAPSPAGFGTWVWWAGGAVGMAGLIGLAVWGIVLLREVQPEAVATAPAQTPRPGPIAVPARPVADAPAAPRSVAAEPVPTAEAARPAPQAPRPAGASNGLVLPPYDPAIDLPLPTAGAVASGG